MHDGDTAGEEWIRKCAPVIARSHTELVACVEDRKTLSRETLPEAGHLLRNVGLSFSNFYVSMTGAPWKNPMKNLQATSPAKLDMTPTCARFMTGLHPAMISDVP